MKSVVHQTLRHIFHFHADAFPLSQIENALVRDESMFAFEEHGEMRIEPFRDVVRVQNRGLGCIR